ncbi:hypothetical protein [Bacillus paralicheniformis]|uniref:hypothetical protein n=1 Tax=Bacillus paralicheniformis TaxID=1648923 RepID=UPI0011AA6198|nr:hypothetical protein [Bacillus paralicheniformis]MBZ5216181.1 hypothetical protein [Bacillus paralicheniformis]
MKKKLLVPLLSASLLIGIASPFASAKTASASEQPAKEVNREPEVVLVKTINYDDDGNPIVLPGESILRVNETANVQNVDVASSWKYWRTNKYSNKIVWTSISSASAALGVYLKIPHLSLAGIVGNWIIANKNSWIYYTDKKYTRMSGYVFQIKHNVTWYKDKKRKKKLQTQVYITNDYGGMK